VNNDELNFLPVGQNTVNNDELNFLQIGQKMMNLITINSSYVALRILVIFLSTPKVNERAKL
jgi:hypothetical protein